MRNKSINDLTPLVDVIIIILFVSLISLYNQKEKYDNEYKKQQEYISSEKENVNILRKENEYLLTVISSFISVNEEDLKSELINKNNLVENTMTYEDIDNLISSLTNTDTISDELSKYYILSKNVYMIDITLSGENNRLIINNKKTDIYIPKKELLSIDKKGEKELLISTLIKDEINNLSKDKIILITLIASDDKYVDKKSWDFLNTTIEDIYNKNINKKIIISKRYDI